LQKKEGKKKKNAGVVDELPMFGEWRRREKKPPGLGREEGLKTLTKSH